MEGHRQCSRLVGRGEWSGIDSAQGLLEGVNGGAYTVLTANWKGWMEGHRECSRLVGRGEWRGIDSAHG